MTNCFAPLKVRITMSIVLALVSVSALPGAIAQTLTSRTLPTITWAPTTDPITSGTQLGSGQLNATANMAGTFQYNVVTGTLKSGDNTATNAYVYTPGKLVLQTTFTPSSELIATYMPATMAITIQVNPPIGTPSYTWQNVAINGGGFVDGVYFNKSNHNREFLKTDVGGLHTRDESATSTWTPLLDWANSYQNSLASVDYWGVSGFATDPTNQKNLYLATGTSSGQGAILISSNLGATFSEFNAPFVIGANDIGRNAGERMAVDPYLPNIIYYGTKANGLWFSDDYGIDWYESSTFPTLDTGNGQGIVCVLPVNEYGSTGKSAQVMFAAVAETSASSNYTLYQTTTGVNGTWSPVASAPALVSGSYPANNFPTRCKIESIVNAKYMYITYNNSTDINGSTPITDGSITRFTFNGSGITSATNVNPTFSVMSGGTTVTLTPRGIGDLALDNTTSPSTGNLLLASINGHNTSLTGSQGQDWFYDSTNYGNSGTSDPSTLTNHGSDSPAVYIDAQGYTSNWNGNWITMETDPSNFQHVIYGTGSMVWETHNLLTTGTQWAESATGVEEAVVLGLAAPPTGNVLLFSAMDDLAGFAHTSLTTTPGNNLVLPSAPAALTSVDYSYASSSGPTVAVVGGNDFL